MGDTSWNLYTALTMAQVSPLATPMVVVGAISRYLALSTAFTMERLFESWTEMLKNCVSNLVSGQFRNKTYCY